MLEKVMYETGLTKAQISTIVIEALDQSNYYFDPDFINELNIEIDFSKEVK